MYIHIILWQGFFYMLSQHHRIIDDRIEKYDAHLVVFSKWDCRNEEFCSSRVKGRGAGPFLPWRTLRPPPFPMPSQAWGTYVVCGCCRAGTTARANALTQIVPILSSLYTLFYSGIYNSVVNTKHQKAPIILKGQCQEILDAVVVKKKKLSVGLPTRMNRLIQLLCNISFLHRYPLNSDTVT